jgi:hypothetical protein
MKPPRPLNGRPWTWDDHLDNEQRIQRAADRRTWDRLGRLIGLRGRELTALLARFMDDRITSAIRAHNPPLLDQLTDPAQAESLRNAIGDLLADDIATMVQILTAKESTHDTRDTEETPGSGGEDAAERQRPVHNGQYEEAEDGGDARE